MSLKIKTICLKCSMVLLFLLFLQVSFAQLDFSIVDKKLQTASKHLGGDISALIYSKDSAKIIYEKNIGKFDKRTSVPIAGAGKWLTTALVMTFVDEGKISLDDQVSKYIPLFTTYKKGYITIRQCLSHQTGIEQKQLSGRGELGEKKFKSLEEEVNYYVSRTEIDYNAGEYFFYGNTGLNIAARVCEIVSKKDFSRLMRDRILRPLQMRLTTFDNENLDKAPNPSGSAKSTPEDYMHFLIMILDKGVYKDKRILSEKAIDEMETAQIETDKIKYSPKLMGGLVYGLGEWIIEKDNNGKTSVVASPGLLGTWPLVDNCRHYAMVIFANETIGNDDRTAYSNIINAVNEVMPNNNCN